MTRKPYTNVTIVSPVAAGSPRSHIKRDFAQRLQRLIINKGWNQSEVARRAQERMPAGSDIVIGRDHISHYVRGVALPRPPILKALASALGVQPEDLIPTLPPVINKAPPLDMRQLEDGNCFLRVNQAVSFNKALRILAILEGPDDAQVDYEVVRP